MNCLRLIGVLGLLACVSPAAELEFKAVDEAVSRFMEQNEIHAASLAISRHGRLLHERAFGFADKKLTAPLSSQVRMRIASISKPITAAALKYLVREGKLKLSDSVVKYLSPPRYAAPVDQGWKAIALGRSSSTWAAGTVRFQVT
ncbi:MAG TPA: serine hydrolase domain-containing protein [Candidatus Binatia bacterium]|nr:serine hydrolase domain-containing protein [Candidatus Binatia bacterium]